MGHILCNHRQGLLENIFQHGFRRGSRHETQLIVTLQDIMKYRNKRIQVDTPFMIYDTVSCKLHFFTIYKLTQYVIKYNTHE